jgi:DNA-binding IclR family transcriptional regulator
LSIILAEVRRHPDNRNGEMNQSLARGLAILEAFARDRPELGVADLTRALALPKSITHRLVRTLAARGFLDQNPATLRYRVGARVFEVGQLFAPAQALVDTALPVLRRLTEDHQLNAYLGVLSEGRALYLLALQSSGPVVIRVSPGSRAPLHSTALGKVLLAAEPAHVAARLLGRVPLPRLTPATIVRPADVLAEVTAVRARGYAVSDEENLPGVFAIGAAVRDQAGRVVAAMSGACPRYAIGDIDAMATIIMDSARAISRHLGFDPAPPRRRRRSLAH